MIKNLGVVSNKINSVLNRIGKDKKGTITPTANSPVSSLPPNSSAIPIPSNNNGSMSSSPTGNKHYVYDTLQTNFRI